MGSLWGVGQRSRSMLQEEVDEERDCLEAFFLRLLLLDNIKQEAQEEAKSTGPKESETEEQSVVVAQNGHFKPRQPRPATPLEEEIAESVCCRCGGTVYRAELRQCRGRSYHSTCFSCFSCHRTLDAMRVSDGPDGEAYCTNCYRQRLGENFEIEDTTIHPLLVFDGTHRACVWQVDLLLDKYVQV